MKRIVVFFICFGFIPAAKGTAYFRFSWGKTYSTIMYGSPEAMNLFVNGLEQAN